MLFLLVFKWKENPPFFDIYPIDVPPTPHQMNLELIDLSKSKIKWFQHMDE